MTSELFILTGFLGSGKTTLLKHLLATTPKKLAVIINEFATLSIDDTLVGKNAQEVKQVAGGCICCNKGKDLIAQIKELSGKYDTLLLETTGVAHIEPIIELTEQTDVQLKGIITVLDAYRFSKAPELDDETKRQVAHANLIVLNKKDLVSKNEITLLKKRVREQNSKATIVVTTQGAVKYGALLKLPNIDRPKHTTKRVTHTGGTLCYETSAPINKQGFEELVQELPPSIRRAKGVVNTPKGTLQYGYATGLTTIEPTGKTRRTKLVFIGGLTPFEKFSLLYKLRKLQTRKNTWQDTKTNIVHFVKQLG
ncbi:MAG: GTP-binding protein [Candidatus Woesearchaeota archaeon]|nr:GTP-binding protein [Candidatus Woesearchaeota archaeon]